MLAGCAAPQTQRIAERPPAGLPAATEIAAAPFFPQEDYQCGPASLAGVLTYAGRATTPEALLPQVYVPGRKGSFQAEMLAATRSHGLVAYRIPPRLEDLLRELAAGNPVLVLQNLALDWAPQWHYAVAIGYDLGTREIILRSGVTRRLVMSLDTFEHTWARGGHWAMVASAPPHMPASAQELAYVAALAALERLDPTAAQPGYEAALARWPDSPAAAIGLGNSLYARRDLTGAAVEYRRATQRHPDFADAWNNLAQALAELGRREEALAAARRAVALGGPRLPQYRETLEAIERGR